MEQKNRQSWLERHITLHNHDDAKAEKANYLTHLAGAILALVALVIILVRNGSLQNHTLQVGMVVYGFSMLLLYSASALYHKLPPCDGKRFCRILDHTNIYFLIAGTYTPILCYVDSPKTIWILKVIWCIVAGGIAFTLLFWGKLRPLHVVIYLVLGWFIVFYWNDIIPYLPSGLTAYILGAGITYTIGVIFYACKKIPHYHAIWHLFCILASMIFFLGFERYLY
jgi:hemolysin III